MIEATSLDPEKYERDEDGLWRAIVGQWVQDKHARLSKYVGISSAVRKKFLGPRKAGATYIDLFSGPGQVRIRDTQVILPGSPICAWSEAVTRHAPFSQMHIADANAELVRAAESRLKEAGAPVQIEVGPADFTIDRIIAKLYPSALHFAFLDPFKLEPLSFEIVRKLAKFERMDILLHISALDLQRNLGRYIGQEGSPLDSFAPGWRERVDPTQPVNVIRGKILEHWRSLLFAEGMTTTETKELVRGSKKQRLY